MKSYNTLLLLMPIKNTDCDFVHIFGVPEFFGIFVIQNFIEVSELLF
jgi:hypothetical protein